LVMRKSKGKEVIQIPWILRVDVSISDTTCDVDNKPKIHL